MRLVGSFLPRRVRLRWWGSVAAAVLATGIIGAAPGVARAQLGCQDKEATPTYTDECGPEFVLPPWGDGSGWTDPSKFTTIQLADVNGDGRDELLARNDQGLEIWWFDTAVGQWRPQVDAQDLPQVLTDFRSPAPNETPETDWTKPEYYSTIQTAHLNGSPGAQVIARFADGMRVYSFTPGPGGSIDGGSWSLTSQEGLFSDAAEANDPSVYSTLRTGSISPSGDPALSFLTATVGYGLYNVAWDGLEWGPTPAGNSNDGTVFSDDRCGTPSCYQLFRTAELCQRGSAGCPTGRQALIGRTSAGVEIERYDIDSGDWSLLPGSADGASTNARIFGDAPGPDCPFTGTTDCLGSSPWYYETFGVADVDGDGFDEIFARGADGLRVRKLDVTTGRWTVLPTLTDLAGSGLIEATEPGLWGSIRTANIDGRGGEEVLALNGGALQVWSYQPAAKSWQRWQPSTALTLTDDWLTEPEYYATIGTGDVDGDGHDEVVARGQYGIRTWFYNRRGTGGWERYLPEGYPTITGGDAGNAAGRQNAFDALTDMAKHFPTAPETPAIPQSSGSVRDVYTKEQEPTDDALGTLQAKLLAFAGCTGPTDPGGYSCTKPSDAALQAANAPTTFDSVDWTWVMNEVLGEIADATAVVDHFTDVATMNAALWPAESTELASIAGDLQIAGAAGNGTSFAPQSLSAGATGIAASLAGLIPDAGAEVSAALWVASEAVGMLPSASETATEELQTTYAGLQDQFTTILQETDKARTVQSQQVRSDRPLMSLLAQLRTRGTWVPDTVGMASASRQAFALWVYQALLPTIYRRYAVTNCVDSDSWSLKVVCVLPDKGPYVIGGGSGQSATWIGPIGNDPCPQYVIDFDSGKQEMDCTFGFDPGVVPDSVGKKVWGALSETCEYDGKASTAWTFSCSLGVPVAKTIAADSPGWTFTTLAGQPALPGGLGGVRAVSAGVSATAAQRRVTAPTPRIRLGPLRLRGRTQIPRKLRQGRRTRVIVVRTLFEHGRRAELARGRSGRKLKPFALKRVRAGVFASRERGKPRVRLTFGRTDARRRTRVDLQLDRVRIRDIRRLCGVLPAAVSRTGPPLELETRVRLRNGSRKDRVAARQRWRCTRDRHGEFAGIRPVRRKPLAARPGLAVAVKAPRVLPSGRRARVRVTVRNTRSNRRGRLVSSLYDLRIAGSAGGRTRAAGIKELRARRTRTVRLTVPVPADARGPVCVRVVAVAVSARSARARRCTAAPGRGRAAAARDATVSDGR
jgi:hypothetical protein